jgi:hypothetical protein
VAVQGLGGLGHLGVQFAARWAIALVAVGRGQDKTWRLNWAPLATSTPRRPTRRAGWPGWAVRPFWQPRRTVNRCQVIDGLGIGGKLLSSVHQPTLLRHAHSTYRCPPVDSRLAVRNRQDSEDTLNFCALTGIRPMVGPSRLNKRPPPMIVC